MNVVIPKILQCSLDPCAPRMSETLPTAHIKGKYKKCDVPPKLFKEWNFHCATQMLCQCDTVNKFRF